jgi:hypothetical protein
VFVDGADVCAVALGHQGVGEPNGLVVEAAFEPRATVGGLVADRGGASSGMEYCQS